MRNKSLEAYGVTGIPSAFLIAPDGTVSAAGHPMSMDLPELIRDLLAKK